MLTIFVTISVPITYHRGLVRMPSFEDLATRAGFVRDRPDVSPAPMGSPTASVHSARAGTRPAASHRGHSGYLEYSPNTSVQADNNNNYGHLTSSEAGNLGDDQSDLDAFFPGFTRCSERSSSIASTVSTFMSIQVPRVGRAIYDSQESLWTGSTATSQSDSGGIVFGAVDYTRPARRRGDSIQFDPLDTSEAAMNHSNATAVAGIRGASRPGLAPAPLVICTSQSAQILRTAGQESESASFSPHGPRGRLESVRSSQPLVRRSSQQSHQAVFELAIHSPSSCLRASYSFDSESSESSEDREESTLEVSPVGPRIQNRGGNVSILRRVCRAAKQRGIAPAWKRVKRLARMRAD